MKQKNKNCIDEHTSLDIDVSNVFVVKNSKQRAFIEQFNYNSVNFTQKDLGNILGFFIVRDDSPSSENIVNFLASEVKKKYFSSTEKPTEEKFELTLHHINRALEEIANIGNVDWLGTIDGVVCVVNDTSIHFSVTGNANIFLLRDNILLNISEGLASTEASENPLKTFVDISSGDLCPHDKIIITSQELLDLVSIEELQKNAIRFGLDNFIQFIETALTNECSLATTTIIDIAQKNNPQTQIKPVTYKDVPKNIFGADAFDTEEVTPPTDVTQDVDEQMDVDDLTLQEPVEYTDPRTGHIHIQGNTEPIKEMTSTEKIQESWNNFIETLKETTSKHSHTISKKVSNLKNKETIKPEKLPQSQTNNSSEEFDNYENINITTKENSSATTKKKFSNVQKKTRNAVYKLCTITKKTAKNTSSACINFITNLKNHKQITIDSTLSSSIDKIDDSKKHSILPSVHNITKLWRNMNIQTKLITIGILAFTIITPLLFFKLSNTSKNEDIQTSATEQEVLTKDMEESSNLPKDSTSQDTIEDPTILLEDTDTTSATFINDRQIGITKDAIIIFDRNKNDSFSIPKNAGEIELVTPMDDLDLIFLLTTKNELYSFSPSTKKFTKQENIPTLDHTKIKELGTFMTYIYTMDNSMIKRFTRQDGGFSDGKDWLAKTTDLSQATTLAIDDDIYTASDGKITKFTKGQESSFSQSANIKNIFLIYTTEDTRYMWLLDTENNKLFKVKKGSGKKIEEFTHTDFAQATSFIVDEKRNEAIISTNDKILSFAL